ncbi:DMT family transporter [Paracoccus luteus]|uniref:DMT family transporter n=1 Tax=Paracoccus luteus TaxID=2508543 RepID=UPI00106F111A|nr:DMT family transporter [Paracoccus luteus]
MTNALLFVATVLVWGTTWIGIRMQVGPVPVPVSVMYRFGLAAAILLAALALSGRLRWPAGRHHPFLVLQALCLFSLNFLCFYAAAGLIPSGLVSVIFSLATIFNAMNARIFFAERITARVALAAVLGAAGVGLLFARDLAGAADPAALHGIGLAVMGTLFFSLGNMVSRRNSAAGVPLMSGNAWSMGYGALILLALVAVTGTPVVAPPDGRYLAALVYLAVFASVIGFTTYLMMVARMGTSRAAYATVLFPVIALTISTLFEGYRWHWTGFAGLALALAGNLVLFARPAGWRRPR